MLYIDHLWVLINNIVFQATPINHGIPVHPETLQQSHIVSGWEAEEGQFPYLLFIRMINPVGGVNDCGGSIIHAEWGLTAAHCTAGWTSFVVRAGASSLPRPEIIFETTEFYNHPLYDNSNHLVVQPNDIALLKFGTILTFTPRVQPIRLQRSLDKDKNYDGLSLIVAGWGPQRTLDATSENLHWMYFRGVKNIECWLQYQFNPIIVDSTICAQYYNVTSQFTCQGESGGSLIIEEEDGYKTQVGVTSFVNYNGCHTPIPTGFTRPGHYHNWFTEVTGINFDWVDNVTTTTTMTPATVHMMKTNLETITVPDLTTIESEVTTEDLEITTMEPEISTNVDTEINDSAAFETSFTLETEINANTNTEIEVTTPQPENEITTTELDYSTITEPELEVTTSELEYSTILDPEIEVTTAEPKMNTTKEIELTYTTIGLAFQTTVPNTTQSKEFRPKTRYYRKF